MAFIQYFLMHGLHLLQRNWITSLHALKYFFLQYAEVGIFTLFVQNYSHETQIIQHLTYFGPTPDMDWPIHYLKKEFWNSFSAKNSVIF